MPGDPQTSAEWVQRATWCNGTVPVGARTPWCAVLPLIPNCSGFFFACVLILVLCTFPFALEGAEVTPACFVIGYSTLILWQKSGGELESLKGKLSGKFSPPGSDGKCYCRQPAELREEKKFLPSPGLDFDQRWHLIRCLKRSLSTWANGGSELCLFIFSSSILCVQHDPGCQLRSGDFAI